MFTFVYVSALYDMFLSLARCVLCLLSFMSMSCMICFCHLRDVLYVYFRLCLCLV